VRTAPAPMYLLARLTREHDIKVVLTGEGSDELFLGYDLFKETALRLFCLRQPQSRLRPRLFERLYPYLDPAARRGDFWRRFFLDAGTTDDPLFSHLPRFPREGRSEALGEGPGPGRGAAAAEATLPGPRHPGVFQPGTRRVRAGDPP